MSIEQVQKLSSNVEKLTPILGKSIENLSKFTKNYTESEKKNNEQLNELVSILSVRQSEQMIPPGIIEEMLGLKQENATYQQIIVALIEERDKMEKDLEELFENMEPSTLREAITGAGLGVAGLGVGVAAIEYVAPGSITPVITGRYGEQRKTGAHGGTDLAVPNGTPLRAVSDGKIVDAGVDPGGWGNFVVFVDNKGIYHLYGHVQDGYRGKGDIKKGDIIAKVGTTGRVTGPHLHWETGTSWTGGVLKNKFDPLNRYSMNAPFSTAKDETKPKPQPSQQQALKPQQTQQQVAAVPSSTQQPSQQPQGSQAPSGGRGSVQPNYLSVLQLASTK